MSPYVPPFGLVQRTCRPTVGVSVTASLAVHCGDQLHRLIVQQVIGLTSNRVSRQEFRSQIPKQATGHMLSVQMAVVRPMHRICHTQGSGPCRTHNAQHQANAFERSVR